MSTRSITAASPPRPSTSSTSSSSKCCAARRARCTARTPRPARSTSPRASRRSTPEGRAEITIGNLGLHAGQGRVLRSAGRRHARRPPRGLRDAARTARIYNVTTEQLHQRAGQPRHPRPAAVAGGRHSQRHLWRATTTEQDPECCAQIYVRVGSTQRAAQPPVRGARRGVRNYSAPSTNPFDRLTDLDAELNAEQGARRRLALRAEWDVGPGTFTSVTAWRYWEWGPSNDRDFTGLPDHAAGQQPVAAGPVHAGIPLRRRWREARLCRGPVRLRPDDRHQWHRSSRARRPAAGC